MDPAEKRDFSGMLMSVDEAFVSLDQNWKCIYVNDRATELLGKRKQELLGNIMWNVFPEMNGSVTGNELHSAMDTRTSKSFEIHHPILNKWLNIRVAPHDNGLDVFYNDITQGKLIDSANEHAEERFAKAFNSSPIPLSISRLSDECIVDINDSFLELFEFNKKEVIGKTPMNLKIYGDNDINNTTYNNELISYLRKRDTLNKHELTLFTKTGKPLNLIFSTELILVNGEHHILSTYIDLTEKLKSQKIIADSEAWFRSIADNSPVMLWGADSNQVCNYVNSTFIEFTGQSTKQILESDWTDIIHPEDIESFQKIYNKAFDLRKPFQREYRLKRADGRYRWIFDFAKPILMPDGSFKGYIGSCADVHSKHALYVKLERLVKERTLELTQSLEKEKELNDAKSRFVSMASHEFRTPLSSILSSVYLIEKYADLTESKNDAEYNEKRKKHILRIKNSINHLTEILNDFLSLDKLTQGKVEVKNEEFDLKVFSHEIVEEIKNILKFNQYVNYTYVGETLVFQDKRILKNIFLNLLSNAIKYSEEGMPIQLNIEVTKKKIIIIVEDNGIGIPDEEQNNIFNKFFRAKNALNIEGTGLGLNIVKRYLELLDGIISFTSKPSEGTTFSIQIPKNNIK
ncbi:MAG: PAS domain S-box protein [Bacteroidota bacterium]|nr:PAS domain S-box protein [Bacteroidota bacterium]